eukprot:149934-Amphidinium_carterae.2
MKMAVFHSTPSSMQRQFFEFNLNQPPIQKCYFAQRFSLPLPRSKRLLSVCWGDASADAEGVQLTEEKWKLIARDVRKKASALSWDTQGMCRVEPMPLVSHAFHTHSPQVCQVYCSTRLQNSS